MVYKYGSSGNKIIDDFIRYTQINLVNENGKMEYVPYEQFINIEFIAEGGFSKIYKATWIDGLVINYSNKKYIRSQNYTVVLKKINDSKNITSKELNELKIFYDYSSKNKDDYYIARYFKITQDPNSQDIMIIMPYYDSGDLKRYITKDFFNINWSEKLWRLLGIAIGLDQIHKLNIIHRDLHSGNIFTECWHLDPSKRPQITDINNGIMILTNNERNIIYNSSKIIESTDIGPVPKSNPGAIYKSRSLSAMINSAMSLRSSRNQSINLEKFKKRFEDDLIEDSNDNGQSIKRENCKNEDYLTKEFDLDIDTDFKHTFMHTVNENS
ncbi:kinase-like domain-containing protein [Rhizophagus irregularis DAOM 181602=DAOM 197198]|nr:kinase-like domain-containing protein [Rhizophagus irregularis DAOM 181602=DAOM 197198]